MSAAVSRKGYLDWLRGLAVVIMIEAHAFDAWTRVEDRDQLLYGWSMVIAGFGAPVFLFLAGIALALAAGARLRRGMSEGDVTRLALKRGAQIFGLAFLFRFQAWAISGGAFWPTLLKVDILNIMGVSMLAAAGLWGLGRGRWSRALVLMAAATGVAMLTPIVRVTELLGVLPDPIEWYLRPTPGRTTFTLFPWGAFLLGGVGIGVWLDAARTARDERRVIAGLAAVGTAMAVGGYAASYLPAIYEVSNFWTTSPTFFFLRLGILVAAVPLAYAWNRLPAVERWSPMREFGVASLFVYWIHVEMAYGVISLPIHRRLPFPVAVLAVLAFALFLFGLVKLKDRVKSKLTHLDRAGYAGAS